MNFVLKVYLYLILKDPIFKLRLLPTVLRILKVKVHGHTCCTLGWIILVSCVKVRALKNNVHLIIK